MKKYQKVLIKEKIKYEKELNKFSKALGIEESTSQEERNRIVLEYVKDLQDFDSLNQVRLSDIQLHYKEFMMNLYNANYRLTKYFKPLDEFKDDLEYIAEYIRIKVCGGEDRNRYSSLEYALFDYKDLMLDPKFVSMISRKVSNENILKIMQRINVESNGCFDDMYSTYKNANDVVIRELDVDVLQQQSRAFGSHFLEYLPKDMAGRTDLIGEAVKCDGFKSLSYLPTSELLENREFVYTATRVSGTNFLKHFLNVKLNPHKKEILDGDIVFEYVDKKLKRIQKALQQDPKIIELLKPQKRIETKKVQIDFEK